MASKFKDILNEAMEKDYGYRIKLAADCTQEHMNRLEQALQKYHLVSLTPFKRSPIEENPTEFVRRKDVHVTSEVCTTDAVLKYPVNERVLEVYVAVNAGVDFDRVICYGVKDPRRVEADMAADRYLNDKDRYVTEEDSVMHDENMEHYHDQQDDKQNLAQCHQFSLDEKGYGEDYNKKFLDELARIKSEKGAEYFRNYPSKDNLMGQKHKGVMDTIFNEPNAGRGDPGGQKEVSHNDQNLGHR